MAREKKELKDEKRIIPMYFQTWGDMMMNMLTLFILLCSFANERKAAFFAAGVGSVIQALESHGMPGLLAGDTKPVLMDNHDDRFKTPMEQAEDEADDPSKYDTMNDIEQEFTPGEDEAWIPGGVLFQRGTANLSNQGKTWLREQLVFFLNGDFAIEVAGHSWRECADESASWKLSLRRAYAVIAYLDEVGGVPLERMHAVGFGDHRPVSAGEKMPTANRRVNIRLAKSR